MGTTKNWGEVAVDFTFFGYVTQNAKANPK